MPTRTPLALFLSMWLAAVLSGCAGSPAFPIRRSQPPPPKVAADVRVDEEMIHDATFGRHYRPLEGKPRAIVVLHHGLLDHGDRYAKFAEQLVHAGFGASTFDMRGHGRSAGARVAIDRVDRYLDDLDAFLAAVRARDPDVPLFLMGHSFGGLVVALHVVERAPKVLGVVLSAPALGLDVGAFDAAAILTIDAVAPGAQLFGQNADDFSTSAAVIADMRADPLIHHDKAPIHTAAVLLDALHRAWKGADAFRRPVLIVHGTIDKLTAPSGSRDFLETIAATDKTLKLYGDLHHDLLHEPNGALVANDIVAWLNAHADGEPHDAPALPKGALKGDRVASSTSLLLEGGAELSRDRELGGRGQLSLRTAFGRPFGWLGGLDARFSSLTATRFEADLFAVGFALRLGLASQLGVTSGFGVGGLRGTAATRVPIETSLEAALGPLRALLRVGVAFRTTGPAPEQRGLGPFDDAWSLLGVRIGRDLRYFKDVTAGSGLYLGFTYRRTGPLQAIGIGLGVDLWGAN